MADDASVQDLQAFANDVQLQQLEATLASSAVEDKASSVPLQQLEATLASSAVEDKASSVQQLRAFAGDEQLYQLEAVLTNFNIFEAIGATHRELAHSHFLAYLLDPEQNHRLGDEFLKRFLREAVPELLGAASFEQVVVRREYRNIDILIEDTQAEAIVIIENKIWSPEGTGQLSVYWKAMSTEYPTWSRFGVYITPAGGPPSDEHYRPLSYKVVKKILEQVLNARSGHLNSGVELVLEHYIDILGRFIMGNTNAADLARQLYFKHRAAVKLMNPNNWKKMIEGYLLGLIRAGGQQFKEAWASPEYVDFRVVAWDNAVGLKSGTSKNTSYNMLYFTFYNNPDSLTLHLSNGPDSSPEIRRQILELVERTGAPFCKPRKVGRSPNWYYNCYDKPFLTEKDYKECSDEELKAVIDEQWRQFVEQDLPAIMKAFEQEVWFWQGTELAS